MVTSIVYGPNKEICQEKIKYGFSCGGNSYANKGNR